MHKKLEAELVSLAHSILQMENKDDVHALQKKAQVLYEKLTLLKFVDGYIYTAIDDVSQETAVEINDTIENVLVDETLKNPKLTVEVEEPISEESVAEKLDEEVVFFDEEIIEVEETIEIIAAEQVIEKPTVENEKPILEQVDEIVVTKKDIDKEHKKDAHTIQFTLEEEFKDAISSDVATRLFERVTKENPKIEEKKEIKPRSLNDSLFTSNLQVGLNDRIAFVKYLFEGSQEDFNRVLSQLNSFKTEDEAKNFIQKFVKPDYNWSTVAEYEERLMNLISRKFL